MNEPQTWTMVIGTLVAVFALLTLMSTMFTRVLRTEIGRVSDKVDGLRVEMSARFEGVDRRLDGLDRDVQALSRRVFGIDTE